MGTATTARRPAAARDAPQFDRSRGEALPQGRYGGESLAFDARDDGRPPRAGRGGGGRRGERPVEAGVRVEDGDARPQASSHESRDAWRRRVPRRGGARSSLRSPPRRSIWSGCGDCWPRREGSCGPSDAKPRIAERTDRRTADSAKRSDVFRISKPRDRRERSGNPGRKSEVQSPSTPSPAASRAPGRRGRSRPSRSR